MRNLLAFLSVITGIALQSRAATLPKERVIIHSVSFSDPRGDDDLVGGNAFDRSAVDIGANKSGTNTALLTVLPAKASGLVELLSEDPTVVSVSPSRPIANQAQQKITISGTGRGLASIKTKRRSEKLGAAVFPPAQLTIAIHSVSDTAGHSASLSSSQMDSILKVVGSIWGGQVNLTFGPTTIINSSKVEQDLGPTVDLLTGQVSPDHQAILSAAKSAVTLNVYVVNALTSDGDVVDGVTPADGLGDVFVSVASKDINRTVAHELGHALGLSRRFGYDVDYEDAGGAGTRRYQLMYGNSPDVPLNGGRTITPFQGNAVNPAIGGTP